MPELPEVEIARRNLERWALGRTIVRAHVETAGKRIVRPHRPAEIERLLADQTLRTVDRRGKYLLLTLQHGNHRSGFVSHLGMTGKWVRRNESDPKPRASRVQLALDDHHVLHYVDSRLFGRLFPVEDARFDRVASVAALGPDPLHEGIDPERLHNLLARTKRSVKVALLDQSLVPGVGNIHAIEALFRARIDPRRRAKSLSDREVRALTRAILASFRDALAKQDGPEITYVEEPGGDNPFRIYARKGERCPRCRRGIIRRIVQGARSTFYCPACQVSRH